MTEKKSFMNIAEAEGYLAKAQGKIDILYYLVILLTLYFIIWLALFCKVDQILKGVGHSAHNNIYIC